MKYYLKHVLKIQFAFHFPHRMHFRLSLKCGKKRFNFSFVFQHYKKKKQKTTRFKCIRSVLTFLLVSINIFDATTSTKTYSRTIIKLEIFRFDLIYWLSVFDLIPCAFLSLEFSLLPAQDQCDWLNHGRKENTWIPWTQSHRS